MNDTRALRSACLSIIVTALLVLTQVSLPACVLVQERSQTGPLDAKVTLRISRASLGDVLRELSSKYHINSMADGKPMRETIDISFEGTGREALDFLCRSIDYSWTPAKSGIILLTKKFTDKRDRPQMIAAEWREVARDEVAILPDVPTDTGHTVWPPLLREAVGRLADEQLQALRAGARMPLSDLPPPQRMLFTRVLGIRVYGIPRGIFSEILSLLDGMDRTSLERSRGGTLMKMDRPEPWAEISLVRRTSQGGIISSAVLGEVHREPSPKSNEGTTASPPPLNERVVKGGTEPPTAGTANVGRLSGLDTRVRLDLGETTLEDIAREVSRQTNLTIEAADSVKQRRLNIVLEDASASQVLDCLVELNDWTWREISRGHYLISRKTVRRPLDLSKVPSAMRSALPVDARNYLRLAGLDNKTLSERSQASHGAYPGNLSTELRSQLLDTVYDTIASGERLPVSKLSQNQRDDLVFVLIFSPRFSDAIPLLFEGRGVHRMQPDRAFIAIPNGTHLMIQMLQPENNSPIGFGTSLPPGR